MNLVSRSLVSSSDLAKDARVSMSLIHYYTALGLLPTHGRKGNKRLYHLAEARERLKKISSLRQRGFSLVVIRDQLLNRGNRYGRRV